MQIYGKTVLITPLNWGLGHATRSMVIINKLLELNCNVIIASDGDALSFLKKEFPKLIFLELPSYKIHYSKNSFFLKLKLASQSLSILRATRFEKKCIDEWIDVYNIDVIISDNRFGVFSAKIPSIYITHQLRVFSGITTWLTSKIHQQIIKKYTACWVPDIYDTNNSLAGNLVKNSFVKYKKMGVLSRLQKIDLPQTIDVLFVISGPEPQRSILEKIFLKEISSNQDLNIVLIAGKVENIQIVENRANYTYYNYATSAQMERLLNSSKLIVCRSGYSTIMDLCLLEKKALLIPTPGQNEQEYLAKYLQAENLLPFVKQSEFIFEDIYKIQGYKGLPIGKGLDSILLDKLFAEL